MQPGLEAMRHPRAAGRSNAPRRRPRRRAIVTIVNNEAVFLPIWLGYYSRFFAASDIYVLDNDSIDGSTRRGGFVRIPVSHDSLDNLWMVSTVQQLQHELLDRYDLVVVTDVDEIVAPSPVLGTLGDYLQRFDQEFVDCAGYEVVHLRDREPPLRLDRPILSQRGYWYANELYAKPAVACVPMSWSPGFHRRADARRRPDPDLRMIHLHRVDYELCRARHGVRARRGWAARDAREGWGAHHFITAEPEFSRWFYDDVTAVGAPVQIEQIPPSWRGIL